MGDLEIFQLRYDIRYAFLHGCNASAILLKASGGTLPGIGSGSDDEALENSASITILDSLKLSWLHGQELCIRVDVQGREHTSGLRWRSTRGGTNGCLEWEPQERGAKRCPSLTLNIDPWVLIMTPLECESEYFCVMVLGVTQTRGDQTHPPQPQSWPKGGRRKRQSFC